LLASSFWAINQGGPCLGSSFACRLILLAVVSFAYGTFVPLARGNRSCGSSVFEALFGVKQHRKNALTAPHLPRRLENGTEG
jgi:hypothetical protein